MYRKKKKKKEGRESQKFNEISDSIQKTINRLQKPWGGNQTPYNKQEIGFKLCRKKIDFIGTYKNLTSFNNSHNIIEYAQNTYKIKIQK